MTPNRHWLLATLALALLPIPAVAEEARDGDLIPDLTPVLAGSHVEVSAGLKESFWTPAYSGNLLDIKTEGLHSVDMRLGLSYQGQEWAAIAYERPLTQTPSQQAMLDANRSRSGSLERLHLFISPSILMGDEEADNLWLRTLYSLRIESTQELFYGTATAVTPFAYVPRSTTVTFTSASTVTFSPPIQGYQAGDRLSFQTKFDDLSASFYYPNPDPERPFDFGLGYFQSQWLRPSTYDERWRTSPGNLVILYETTLKSRGIQFSVESTDRNRPGWNGDMLVRWGLDNTVTNNVHRQVDGSLLYGSGRLDLWYTWYARPESRGGWMAVAGFGAERRYFGTKIHPFQGGVERDDLAHLFVRLGHRF